MHSDQGKSDINYFSFFCQHSKEYKALRLTGGLDHCSGRVEIHRNGLWGTVCDETWDKEEASMVCAMLGCGEARVFKGFKMHFTHKNGTIWLYQCFKNHKTLWDCVETDVTTHPFYKNSEGAAAAVVICNSK